jgi:hypothetical protein
VDTMGPVLKPKQPPLEEMSLKVKVTSLRRCLYKAKRMEIEYAMLKQHREFWLTALMMVWPMKRVYKTIAKLRLALRHHRMENKCIKICRTKRPGVRD